MAYQGQPLRTSGAYGPLRHSRLNPALKLILNESRCLIYNFWSEKIFIRRFLKSPRWSLWNFQSSHNGIILFNFAGVLAEY